MSHFVIQANLGDAIVFQRETPVQSGVENLINEGLSRLLATTGGRPTEDAYVEVLYYSNDDPTPEVDMIIFADEIDATFYDAETSTKQSRSILPKGISPKEAGRRIALKSKGQTFEADTMEWDIDYLESYETPYGTKLDGSLYNPTTGETAEFEGASIKTNAVEIDPMYQNLEIASYEAQDPADAWDNHIHQEEMAEEAYEEYLEELEEDDEPLSFADWMTAQIELEDSPEDDAYLEEQYKQMEEDSEEIARLMDDPEYTTLEGTLDAETFHSSIDSKYDELL